MFVAPAKSGFVREAWVWKKVLKFLGIIYNPFIEKLQACTRKGARTILETSKSAVFKGERFIGVEDGIFTRERPYEKVGDVIETAQWRGF
jgi:hypothetical protein